MFVCFFRDRVSLYSSGCPGTRSVDQAALELRNPPASVSQVLGLKECATTAQWTFNILMSELYVPLEENLIKKPQVENVIEIVKSFLQSFTI